MVEGVGVSIPSFCAYLLEKRILRIYPVVEKCQNGSLIIMNGYGKRSLIIMVLAMSSSEFSLFICDLDASAARGFCGAGCEAFNMLWRTVCRWIVAVDVR